MYQCNRFITVEEKQHYRHTREGIDAFMYRSLIPKALEHIMAEGKSIEEYVLKFHQHDGTSTDGWGMPGTYYAVLAIPKEEVERAFGGNRSEVRGFQMA